MEIRAVEPEEYARLGALTVEAYARLDGSIPEPDYDAELADVRGRAEATATEVLVAVDGSEVLGGVTFVEGRDSPLFEHDLDEDVAAIRMLAVAPAAQGRGVGEALTLACIARAEELGRRAVVLHSTPWMTGAHRLYGRLGFARDPAHDWRPLPQIELLAFRLELVPR